MGFALIHVKDLECRFAEAKGIVLYLIRKIMFEELEMQTLILNTNFGHEFHELKKSTCFI